MTSEYEMSFKDYLAVIKHRALPLALTVAAIIGVSVLVATSIPPVYESAGTILVESQQISTDLVAGSNDTFADERIEVIRQRVMTREHLESIVDKYGLFASTRRPLSVTEKVEEMRNAIVLTLVSASVKGRGEVTIAFRLAFEHKDPEIAHKVAKELVTLFLDENIKQRTERATETTEFLTQEASKLRVELEALEKKVADFKKANGKSLPEHQELRMTMLSRTELELREVDRDYKTTQEQLRSLDLELSAASANAGVRASTAPADKPQDLGSLKQEYARLLSIYTDAHPDVRAVKRKIAALEATNGGAVSSRAPVSLEVARVQGRIDAASSNLRSLAVQKQQLATKMNDYERDIVQAPQVESSLVALMRDYDNARKKYEEIRTKEMSAKISESLEQDNKAERFVLLEPPLMPEKPVRPNRKKVVALGFVLAPIGAGALLMLLEMLNPRVRGVGALTNVLGRRVLVAIPYIHTQAELAKRRNLRQILVVAAILVFAVVLVLVHVLYMPLDLLLFKALARFE